MFKVKNHLFFGFFLKTLDSDIVEVRAFKALFGRPSHVGVKLEHFGTELYEQWIHILHAGELAFRSAFKRKLLDVSYSVLTLDKGKVFLDVQTSGNDTRELVFTHGVLLTFRGQRLAKFTVEGFRHFLPVG